VNLSGGQVLSKRTVTGKGVGIFEKDKSFTEHNHVLKQSNKLSPPWGKRKS